MGDYLFDIIIIALLAVFAWQGATRGLFLSLCGLAAIAVAFFGAQFVSEQFCEPVGNILRPIIVQSIRKVAPEAQPVILAPESNTSAASAYPPIEEVLASIQAEELFQGFSSFLEKGVKNKAVETGDRISPVEALAGYLAKGIARALLFGLVFICGSLAWFLLSHALDLAFKLPILAEINLAAGLIVGLIKGALFAMVLVWLGQVAGLIPTPPDTVVVSLFTVDTLWELLDGLPA